MHILVSPQAARVLEGLGADVAGVRTLSSMLAKVILVMRTPLEGQGAIGAQEGAHSCMDALVDLGIDREQCETSFSGNFCLSLHKIILIKGPLLHS